MGVQCAQVAQLLQSLDRAQQHALWRLRQGFCVTHHAEGVMEPPGGVVDGDWSRAWPINALVLTILTRETQQWYNNTFATPPRAMAPIALFCVQILQPTEFTI